MGIFDKKRPFDRGKHKPGPDGCVCDECHRERMRLLGLQEAERKALEDAGRIAARRAREAKAMRDHKQAVVDNYIDNELRRVKLLAELNAVSQDMLLARHTLCEFVPPAESAYFNHSTSDAKVIVSRQITLTHIRHSGQPQRRVEVVVNGFTTEEKANG